VLVNTRRRYCRTGLAKTRLVKNEAPNSTHFENWSILGKDVDKRLWLTFFGYPVFCICHCSCHTCVFPLSLLTCLRNDKSFPSYRRFPWRRGCYQRRPELLRALTGLFLQLLSFDIMFYADVPQTIRWPSRQILNSL